MVYIHLLCVPKEVSSKREQQGRNYNKSFASAAEFNRPHVITARCLSSNMFDTDLVYLGMPKFGPEPWFKPQTH